MEFISEVFMQLFLYLIVLTIIVERIIIALEIPSDDEAEEPIPHSAGRKPEQ